MHVFYKSMICFTECYHSVKNRTNLYWNQYVKSKSKSFEQSLMAGLS